MRTGTENAPARITGTEDAPAKINLALDILRRRDDGYHDMRMIMQTVSLSDIVTVCETAVENTDSTPPLLEEHAEAMPPLLRGGRGGTGFSLEIEGDTFPVGKTSLEERTAAAFFASIEKPLPGLRVTLKKNIPAYAGLGGGSADVAALLRILRKAYCPDLSLPELERIGLTVGSDMPFCVRGGTALAEGRGEILSDLPPLPDCRIVICKPDFGIPTPSLFAQADRMAFQRRPDIDGMIAAIRRGDLIGIAARLCNVFEEALSEGVSPEQYKEVIFIKERLISLGALNAAMSGSGPAVFGIFADAAAAHMAADTLRRAYRQTFLAKPV